MNPSYLTVPFIFLINSLFSLYILAVVLRFLLQCVRADFHNPIAQVIVKVTHPPLKFLRRFIPPLGQLDSSSILFAFVLQILMDGSVYGLKGLIPAPTTLLVISLANLISVILNIFIVAIIIHALFSWFNPNMRHPVVSLVDNLVAPLLKRCRKLIPTIDGLDLSPMLALLVLGFISKFLTPLESLAYSF